MKNDTELDSALRSASVKVATSSRQSGGGGAQRKAAMETRAKAKIAERNQKTACKGIEGTEKSEGRRAHQQ